MKIVVCIKQVPMDSNVKADPVTGNLKRHMGEKRMNPYDARALNTVLMLREVCDWGDKIKLIVLSMGPESAGRMLQDALAMGADEAILLCDPFFAGADVLATSRVLCSAIRRIDHVDLVVFGKQTTDGDTGQVGAETARMLGIPCVYQADTLQLLKASLYFERNLSDRRQAGSLDFPCAVCLLPDEAPVKAASLKQKMAAKKKVCHVWGQSELHISQSGLLGSATKVKRIYPPQQLNRGQYFEGSVDAFRAFLRAEIQQVQEPCGVRPCSGGRDSAVNISGEEMAVTADSDGGLRS